VLNAGGVYDVRVGRAVVRSLELLYTRVNVLATATVCWETLPPGRDDVPRVASLGHHPVRGGRHRGVHGGPRAQRVPGDAPDQQDAQAREEDSQGGDLQVQFSLLIA
jgi:hypothetical protein